MPEAVGEVGGIWEVGALGDFDFGEGMVMTRSCPVPAIELLAEGGP